MFHTGPQLQTRDRTVPCRTRTASSGSEPSSLPDSIASERSLPDPNSKLRTRMFLQLFHFSCVFVFCFHVFHFCSRRSSFFHVFSFFSFLLFCSCFFFMSFPFFQFFSFPFIFSHVFSFCAFFPLKKAITKPDLLQFDTLFSFAEACEMLKNMERKCPTNLRLYLGIFAVGPNISKDICSISVMKIDPIHHETWRHASPSKLLVSWDCVYQTTNQPFNFHLSIKVAIFWLMSIQVLKIEPFRIK